MYKKSKPKNKYSTESRIYHIQEKTFKLFVGSIIEVLPNKEYKCKMKCRQRGCEGESLTIVLKEDEIKLDKDDDNYDD